MKVYYPGPGLKAYHPQLGKLITDAPFELDDKLAEQYIKSGLLKKARSSKIEITIKTEEKDNGNS